jgi:hypothetical protein
MVEINSIEKILQKPQYKSILNLLIHFQDRKYDGKTGLRPLHFRYVLEQGYRESKDVQVVRTISRMQEFFGTELNQLIRSKRIVESCITSKSNLTKFLNSLRTPTLNLIEKYGSRPDVRYKIKNDVQKQILRIENKKALDLFPAEKIMDITSRSSLSKHIIYGLSGKDLMALSERDRNDVENCISHIEEEINKIKKIKTKLFGKELDERIGIFIHKTKSIRIRTFLEENAIKLWAVIQNVFLMNKHCSKTQFYRSLAWIFQIPDRKSGESVSYNILILSSGKELRDFLKNRPETKTLPKKKIDEYCGAWSKNFFGKDFNFSVRDIFELIEWAWNNRDLYFENYPLSLAFCRYSEYETIDV